ncbi:MAG: hypothetical protein JW783_06505 [Bacteroidales bacterium]|nr:hypothetical protein [Bacteroidales bacterium]MBN2750030.1 hypothetical protein [Bacteroidales bacterium]
MLKRIVLFFALVFGVIAAYGQNGALKPLFASDSIMELSLVFDLKTVIRDIDNVRATYHPAILTYTDSSGLSIALDVKVKTRGHFRKQRDNCTFPPLRINFKKKQVVGTVFEGQDKLKLVTHCRTNNEKFEQFLIEEYLIYKLYNLFTNFSFNVRLVKINYIDLNGKTQPFSKYAFFLEHLDHLAQRLGATVVDTKGLHQETVDYAIMNQLVLFQYLIGNTDWSVPNLHNIELLLVSPGRAAVPVPYDFDFSGLLNVPYAKPPAHLPIKSVKQRLFRGYCRTREQLEPNLETFRQLQDSITYLYKASTLLTPYQKKRTVLYLEEFFETINDEREIKSEFINGCRRD